MNYQPTDKIYQMQTQSNESKPVILVTGATGAEGGSVTRALLRENRFRVRILTRNPQSQKEQIFKRAGAELVTGDLSDSQSLVKAMEGCYGVFGVTSYWEQPDKEYQHGKNLADAAQQSGIRHLVMHTLPDYNKLSNGKYSVPHYDIKAKLEYYIRSLALPASFVQMAFHYEHFFSFFPLQKDREGGYYFGFPQGNTRLAMASVEDSGRVVAWLFNNREESMGKTIMVTGADHSCDEYAAIMSKVLNKNIYYTYIPRNEYAAYDLPGAREMANMFEVQRLYIPERQKEMEESYRINPAMQGFEQWVTKNKAKFIHHFNSQFEVFVI